MLIKQVVTVMIYFRRVSLGGALVATLLFSAPTMGQEKIENDPGYVNFDVLSELVDVEPHIEVVLKGSLLRLAAEASRVEDEQLAEILLRLKAIRIEGYELGRGRGELADQLRSAARSITKDLRNGGWDRVAKITKREADVFLYVKERGDQIDGLVAMVIEEDGEAVFVNIVGQIDPAEIGRIGRRFDIHGLEVD